MYVQHVKYITKEVIAKENDRTFHGTWYIVRYGWNKWKLNYTAYPLHFLAECIIDRWFSSRGKVGFGVIRRNRFARNAAPSLADLYNDDGQTVISKPFARITRSEYVNGVRIYSTGRTVSWRYFISIRFDAFMDGTMYNVGYSCRRWNCSST